MKDSITHLHAVCEDWKKELRFFKDEIRILRHRLSDIVLRNHDRDMMVQVEHFENKFNILERHVKELMREVKGKDKELVSQAAAQPQAKSERKMDTDQTFEDMMLVTSKDFYDTKNEYLKFVSKVF